MKKVLAGFGLALGIVALPAALWFAASPAAAEEMNKAVAMTPDQLKWVPNPGDPSIKMAAAWGNPDKGAHGAFHKFPAGFTAPLHTHSADLRIVVISGTMAVAGEDGVEKRLPAGSYEYQPRNWKHVTKCLPGSECLAFVVADGKFDLKPVEGTRAAPK